MATNVSFSNDANEFDNDSQRMDDEKPSINEEREADLPTEKPHLAGPMALMVCIRFIILNAANAMASASLNVDLDGILEILSTNNAAFDDQMDELQKFAKDNYLNLYICIINQNEKKYYYLNATSVEGYQQWPRAYLVFDKHNRSFYPFYIRDNNNKDQTIFSTNATHILNLFENSVENYKWPLQAEIIQETLEQNVAKLDQEHVSTTNVNHNIENVDNQPKNQITASDVCNLFIQNVQSVIPQVGSQLDRLNYRFLSSEYQLRDTDFVSIKTVCEALIRPLQMLMQLPDFESNHITKTNNMHTSMETDETKTVRNPSSNNNEQDILRNPINTKLTLRLNAQSMPVTNNFNEAISLPKLKLLNQPTRSWHNRELETLGKGCPAVQVEGAPQRTPIQLALPEEIRKYSQQFYIGTHVRTYDGNEHAQKLVVPKHTTVNKNHKSMLNKLQCLEFNDKEVSDNFDLLSKGVFSKINPNDLKNLRKALTFMMVNLYQDINNNKDLKEKDKLIWCRLMFAIYIKLPDGQFKRVSPQIYSDLIKETHGSQSFHVQTGSPDKFCKRGGQIIFIQLEELVKKCDILVYCNGEVLDENDYQIADKILSFETPKCKEGTDDLHVIINNQNTSHSITFKRPYHPHDNHLDPCGVIDED